MPEPPIAMLRAAAIILSVAVGLAVPAIGRGAEDPFAHCAQGRFPSAWIAPKPTVAAPRAATDADGLAPRIEQLRAGKVIARYDSLGSTGMTSDFYNPRSPDTKGGAFSRRPHQNYQAGDLFLVYPAVYRGPQQQPWIGPQVPDYDAYLAHAEVVPENITIRGVTINGVRPVISLEGESASDNTLGQAALYIDRAHNITIENIDIDGRGARSAGKAGVYINGARDVTLRHMRIHGFRGAKANGVFSTVETSGTLRMENLELFDNGGDDGPEHNVYINESRADPTFTVEMRGSYSSDVFYGHLFKSRAQRTVLEGNLFHGGRPSERNRQAEAYLVDIPDGGQLVFRNNILVKDRSGPDSNGVSLTYAPESLRFAKNSVLIEHNTFVALALTYDGSHPLTPMMFRHIDPVSPPANIAVRVDANAFVGYCPVGARKPFAGERALWAGFDRLHQDYRIDAAPEVSGSGALGAPAYRHVAESTARTRASVGAQD